MTISYPEPIDAKKRKPMPLPVAPTPALRADIAIKDAHRFLGNAMAQMLVAAMLAILLSSGSRAEFGLPGIVGGVVLVGFSMAALLWASMQGVSFGTPSYSSGLDRKACGAANYTLMGAIGALAAGFAVIMAMFLAWPDTIMSQEASVSLMRLSLLLSQVLLSVSFTLRAIAALTFARKQIADVA